MSQYLTVKVVLLMCHFKDWCFNSARAYDQLHFEDHCDVDMLSRCTLCYGEHSFC